MTNEEIVQALRQCAQSDCSSCGMCPIFPDRECVEHLATAAASLIERLTAENVILPDGQASALESLRKEIEWKDMVIALAQRKQAEAEAERDALIEQIKERHSCLDCKHFDYCKFDDATIIECMNCVQEGCPCAECRDSSRWEWRGLPEAPEEGDKHGTTD